MTHPPPNLRGPSGRNNSTSHVHSNPVHNLVSQGHVPPFISTGRVPSHGTSHGPSRVPSSGSNYGASHIPSYEPYYEKKHQLYGYGYQQPTYSL